MLNLLNKNNSTVGFQQKELLSQKYINYETQITLNSALWTIRDDMRSRMKCELIIDNHNIVVK